MFLDEIDLIDKYKESLGRIFENSVTIFQSNYTLPVQNHQNH